MPFPFSSLTLKGASSAIHSHPQASALVQDMALFSHELNHTVMQLQWQWHSLQQSIDALHPLLPDASHAAAQQQYGIVKEQGGSLSYALKQLESLVKQAHAPFPQEASTLQEAAVSARPLMSVEKTSLTKGLFQELKLAKAGFHQLQVLLHSDARGECLVAVEGVILASVFRNLFSNARDALKERLLHELQQEQECPSITPWQPTLTLSIHALEGLFLVSISDNAFGMDDALQKRLFERGASTKATLHPHRQRGLGLWFVKQVMDEWPNAGLHMQSQQGVGTTFTLQFPAL